MRRLSPSLLLLLLGCSVAGAVACSKDDDKKKTSALAELGEPIGAEVPASGDVPGISLALAVSKGQDPVPLLPHVVTAISGAVRGCPALVGEERDVTALSFAIEGGKMKVAPQTDSPGVQCLTSALDGKQAGQADTNVANARVEIKVAPASKAP